MSIYLVPRNANDPLMQPVSWQEQTYYTSQYFHAQYLASHQATTKKYQRHKHFLRLLRSIEAYSLYVEHEDIVELAYNKAGGKSLDQIMVQLYKATGYRPITLLNATAQLALSEHLDDELSKQLSVAKNTMAARQMTTLKPRDMLAYQKARLEMLQTAEDMLKRLGQFTARDQLAFADAVRNTAIASEQKLLGEASYGFSVLERVEQLGYTLSAATQRQHRASLGTRVAQAFRLRYPGEDPQEEPRYVDGAVRNVKWYATDESPWIDPIIHNYLHEKGIA